MCAPRSSLPLSSDPRRCDGASGRSSLSITVCPSFFSIFPQHQLTLLPVSYIRDNLILSSTSTISDLLADAGEDLLNKAFRSAKGEVFPSLPASPVLIHLFWSLSTASYLEPFNQLLSLLTEPPAVAAPTSSRLNPLSKTDSERQTFKDGFTRFWETLEGIEMNHRQAKLVPGDTKDRLKEEVTTLVGRAYKGAVVKHAGNLGPKC